jgi:hypothetical protein
VRTFAAFVDKEQLQNKSGREADKQQGHRRHVPEAGMVTEVRHVDDVATRDGDRNDPESVKYCPAESEEGNIVGCRVECFSKEFQCRHPQKTFMY